MKKLALGLVGCVLIGGLIVVLCVVIGKPSKENEDNLMAVTVLYRHGDRTPVNFYPTDPYKDGSLWSAAPGELTNVGKMQQYKLGQWLRKRYEGFLSATYKKSEFYVSSSDESVCLMSALANVAGLFPPQGKDVWENELTWQPIPIHSTPLENDDILGVQHSCAKFQPLLDKLQMEIPMFVNMNTENKKLFKYLSEKTETNVSSLVQASYIFDTLHVENMNNMSLPEWSIEVYDKLKNINLMLSELFTYNETVSRFFIGRFYNEVLSQFNNFANKISMRSDEEIKQKFRIYSTQDVEVYSSLHALKIQLVEAIPFAGTTIFELWKSKEGIFYVQIYYKTDDALNVMKLDRCDEKCDLEKFVEIVQPIIMTEDDYWKECS